jgi:SAM-dependent methyltransferase
MNEHYWDRVAHCWDEHILSSLQENVSGNIAALITAVAAGHRRVLDFGCGIGRYLPLLSPRFDEVVGVDTSRECIGLAQAVAGSLPNVKVHPVGELPRRGARRLFDAVLMANVLIQPHAAVRSRILNLALDHLRRGGILILLVPSIESVHLAEAGRRTYTRRRSSAYSPVTGAARYDPGVIAIHGHPTKHYSADELALLLRSRRLAVTTLDRAEYSWSSESFEALDRRMKERPWDWLVSATRC